LLFGSLTTISGNVDIKGDGMTWLAQAGSPAKMKSNAAKTLLISGRQ
jgi:hypothetical protein